MEIDSKGIKYETISKRETLKISNEFYQLTVSNSPTITIKASSVSIVIANVTNGNPVFKLFGPIIFSIRSGNAVIKVYVENNLFPMCYISRSTSKVSLNYRNEGGNDDTFDAFITRNGAYRFLIVNSPLFFSMWWGIYNTIPFQLVGDLQLKIYMPK